jgi:hypothetical protein
MVRRLPGFAAHPSQTPEGAAAGPEEATVKTICAWCEHEGKTVVVAECEPADDPTVRYGICETHTSKLVSQLHKYSRPARSRPAA